MFILIKTLLEMASHVLVHITVHDWTFERHVTIQNEGWLLKNAVWREKMLEISVSAVIQSFGKTRQLLYASSKNALKRKSRYFESCSTLFVFGTDTKKHSQIL